MTRSAQTDHAFDFCGAQLLACASGALFWPAQELLCVSDLHFGKAQRYAGMGGAALPPYETRDTLARLDSEIARFAPTTVLCLGDSFDALAASRDLDASAREWILRLQAGRTWIWLEGNHDPGPLGLGGTHLSEKALGLITFRHIAVPGASGEISGHYHPKATLHTRGRSLSRKCFAIDTKRIIMPAFGTYTGGLNVRDRAIAPLLSPDAICVMTGKAALPVPLGALKL